MEMSSDALCDEITENIHTTHASVWKKNYLGIFASLDSTGIVQSSYFTKVQDIFVFGSRGSSDVENSEKSCDIVI